MISAAAFRNCSISFVPQNDTLASMKKAWLLLVVLLASPTAFSQTANAAKTPPTPLASSPETITLGNSAVALNGPWKFQPGDSPWVNGAPLWAQSGFDDSHWAAMDLTSKAGAMDPMNGTTGYVPGWTQTGYPDLSGYAWYRLRLRVKNADQPLWLKMPNDIDDAYQVFANGRYVGQYGRFSGKHVTLYYSEPASFALPSPGPDGELDVAVRFYMGGATFFGVPDAGGMHEAPGLGLASTIRLLQTADYDALVHSDFGLLLQMFLFILVAPLALWAWLYNRHDRTWMWLFLALAWSVFNGTWNVLAALTTTFSIATATWEGIVFLPLWLMFWWNWFGLQEEKWIPRTAWALSAAIMLLWFCVQSPYLGLNFVPQSELHWFNSATYLVAIPLSLLMIPILVLGFRRDRLEALMAAFPIVLGSYSGYGPYLLNTFHIRSVFYPFGLGIGVGNMVAMLQIVVVGALALRRFVRTQVVESLTRQAAKKDLEQAQQLQQRVLVPEIVNSRVFSVESEYRPAQTVGGDFFQTLTKPDGTLLIVIGDVSGKGVSAAMLVAVLVGAIRNQAEYSLDPALMLATLNRRMVGRSGGHFATCMAAELSPSGQVRIANAGHMPPYLNGKELDLEGSLPLGIKDEAEYRMQTITLRRGDKLLFMTDGVVEATNRAKELFGFDRARAISSQHAAAIVEQAQIFGQEDDITVLGVEFAAA
jgi:hypothetical protein